MVLAIQSLEELETLSLEFLLVSHKDQPGLFVDGLDNSFIEFL
jgi:hypothetical protein